jgi:hypothetical protein
MREKSVTLKTGIDIALSNLYYLTHDRIGGIFRLKPKKSSGEVYRLRHDSGIKIMHMLKKCPSDGTQSDKYSYDGSLTTAST